MSSRIFVSKVWDEANPVEASEVALKEPEAHIVRVFAIVGIKHFEDKDAQKYKGRIVVSGDKVKTATGQWAVFQEIGASRWLHAESCSWPSP